MIDFKKIIKFVLLNTTNLKFFMHVSKCYIFLIFSKNYSYQCRIDIFYLIVFLGIHHSKIFALHWTSVNFEIQEFCFNKACKQVKTSYIKKVQVH